MLNATCLARLRVVGGVSVLICRSARFEIEWRAALRTTRPWTPTEIVPALQAAAVVDTRRLHASSADHAPNNQAHHHQRQANPVGDIPK